MSFELITAALKEELMKDWTNYEMVAVLGHERCIKWLDKVLASVVTIPEFTVLRINTLNASGTPSCALQSLGDILESHEAIIHPELPDVLIVNPSAKTTDGTPVLLKKTEVIIDLKCGMAVLRGSHIFSPGVLSASPCMAVGDEVSVYVDIERKCLRGSMTHFEGRKVFIGNGIARVSRNDLFVSKIKKGLAVAVTETLSRCPSLHEIPGDLFFAQNLPSIVCGHVLGAKPGDTILDLCAAPGGKCTHLAALMQNTGIIVALDKTKKKIDRIKSNCSKLGVKCVHPFVFDSTKAWNPTSATKIDHTIGVSGPPYGSETFDRVLLDAPCSALGQRPQLAITMSINELHSYPKLQQKLMANAVHLVKTGGVLVYSTCTFTLQENECLVQWTLKTYPRMKLAYQEPHLGERGLPHVGLTLDQTNHLQRFGVHEQVPTKPSHDFDTIGFFIAKFVKEAIDQ